MTTVLNIDENSLEVLDHYGVKILELPVKLGSMNVLSVDKVQRGFTIYFEGGLTLRKINSINWTGWVENCPVFVTDCDSVVKTEGEDCINIRVGE